MQEEVRKKIADELFKERLRLEENLSSLLSAPQREHRRMNFSNYEPDPDANNGVCCGVLKRLIDQTDKALSILENHPEMYGICERCGKFIPEDRLLALPQATSCVNCA